MSESNSPLPTGNAMSRSTGQSSGAPYVHHRTINWGDTDAAQIAFTVRFFDFAMEAIEGWFRTVLEVDWYILNIDMHLGTPFVHVDMDFLAPLTPRHGLSMSVLIEKLGRASLTFQIIGVRSDGIASFKTRFVCCFVDNRSMKPASIPPDFRRRIEEYIDATPSTVET